MHDETMRLRMSTDPDSVDFERKMAESLFQSAMRDRDLGQRWTEPELVRAIAKRSIEAACIFWQEWDIAVLTPDMKQVDPDEEGSGGSRA